LFIIGQNAEFEGLAAIPNSFGIFLIVGVGIKTRYLPGLILVLIPWFIARGSIRQPQRTIPIYDGVIAHIKYNLPNFRDI
jgi:hypothetical protein